ncbi:hypothetical protein M3223_07575 [Paenibacillus pasadenensis]|uniref:hypothetical protein n=1 Tax=Paenibacillus pasadenensis TaxID=217090 RepID=UPI00203D1BCC|nr:hypothetical protein [Paenibacillus pasadenensis]MCM3747213.1 hypothetical protein [Paenibacillus pasadenensis]
MAIQFLDERLSTLLIDSSGTELLSNTPLLIGDIGLQVAAAQLVPEHLTSVRVSLTGMIGIREIEGPMELSLNFTIRIERNGTDTFGSGTVIFEENFILIGEPAFSPLAVVAGDFPPADVVMEGQIRYTMFISLPRGTPTLTGPVTFNGSAATGTTI